MRLFQRLVIIGRVDACDELFVLHPAAHLVVDQEGDAAEHFLFGAAFFTGQSGADALRENFIVSHGCAHPGDTMWAAYYSR